MQWGNVCPKTACKWVGFGCHGNTRLSPFFSKVLYDICYFISACIVVSGFGKTELGPIGIFISHPLSFLFSFRFFLIFPSSPLLTGLPIVMARNMTVRHFWNLLSGIILPPSLPLLHCRSNMEQLVLLVELTCLFSRLFMLSLLSSHEKRNGTGPQIIGDGYSACTDFSQLLLYYQSFHSFFFYAVIL